MSRDHERARRRRGVSEAAAPCSVLPEQSDTYFSERPSRWDTNATRDLPRSCTDRFEVSRSSFGGAWARYPHRFLTEPFGSHSGGTARTTFTLACRGERRSQRVLLSTVGLGFAALEVRCCGSVTASRHRLCRTEGVKAG